MSSGKLCLYCGSFIGLYRVGLGMFWHMVLIVLFESCKFSREHKC